MGGLLEGAHLREGLLERGLLERGLLERGLKREITACMYICIQHIVTGSVFLQGG